MADAIVVEDLHKFYKEKHAVCGVSFRVAKGEIFGIVGPNGAGKTTTLEILEGLRRRDRGSVKVLGLDPQKQARTLRERIGIQFQSTSIQERLKVREALTLFSSLYKKQGNVDRAIESFDLKKVENTYFKDLSGGWKQRLMLALATIHDPELIFLDEPSTGLDPNARREIWALIKQLRDASKTIVITTHYMEEAEKLCDRVAMFKGGEVAALDTPKRLIATSMGMNYLSFLSSTVDRTKLRAIHGVSRVECEGETVKVYCADLQAVSLQVFQLAQEQKWKIDAFCFEMGSLDDLFVQLIGGGEKA
ncbi:ABC transporter ATP-binding protein [Sulfoacidibacillus thermotolerans]|uniref:ABC transporter ATP-binding protein n=1 Tax=Sulfoacidibacillus thermotolerans TaxID=1765684 RepID=A0A2U3DBA5_SULT2|nr:ABC transporter ATP-binding protein [Sulfoacidibacillus thermotolerans]PWI58569.1 ABC transporter ATP-binding protein [Sulfoacidibacillus thermotolerans]